MRKLLGFLCVCALAIVTARAQDAVDDYVSSAAGQSVIYHGKEQLKYPTSIRNHPYLKSEKYVPGDLSFEGILYKGVKMRLDLYKNELLLLSPDNRYNIVLPSDRVDYAEFHGYDIFYRYPDERSGNLSEGYYLRLHEGKCTVLGKWSCILSKTIKDMQVDEQILYPEGGCLLYREEQRLRVEGPQVQEKRAGPVYQAAKAGFQARSRGSHRSRGETV